VRRTAPRPLSAALERVTRRATPASSLARSQERWRAAVGPGIAREAEPVAERDGVLTVACTSSTWAQELELLAPELLRALNGALERDGHGRPLRGLRPVTRTARTESGLEGPAS
jgi:predicted nucleic acid-binding Zn ribbon protein